MGEVAAGWGKLPRPSSEIATAVLSNGTKLPVQKRLAELVKVLCEATIKKGYPIGYGTWGYCLAGETLVMTPDGDVPISELAGITAKVLTRGEGKGGRAKWVDAPIRSYGVQPLRRVVFSRNGVQRIIYATPEHRWFTEYRRSGTEGGGYIQKERTTKGLRPGQTLTPIQPFSIAARTAPSPVGVMHGIMTGDGTVLYRRGRGEGRVALYGEKMELERFFPATQGRSRYQDPDVAQDPYLTIFGLPAAWKEALPSLREGTSYLYGWLAGFFATDGHCRKDGSCGVSNTVRENLEFAELVCRRLGIRTFPISASKAQDDSYATAEMVYELPVDGRGLDSNFFLRQKHRENWNAHEYVKETARWKVESVQDTDRVEEVFCAEVPETECFALADYILTHNCARKIRGGNSWSAHSGGTAIDINAPCLTGSMKVVTAQGIRTIAELAGRVVELLTTEEDPTSGEPVYVWRKAPVQSFGVAPTFDVTFSRRGIRTVVRTTGNHRWFSHYESSAWKDGKTVPLRRRRELRTDELLTMKTDERVMAAEYPVLVVVPNPAAIAQGVVWGDGSVANKHGGRTPQAVVELCTKAKQTALTPVLSPYATSWHGGGVGPRAWGLPAEWKSLPDPDSAPEMLAGFFIGWFACDGSVGKTGMPTISSSDPTAVAWVQRVAPTLGLCVSLVKDAGTARSGYGGGPGWEVQFLPRSFPVEWALLAHHRERLAARTGDTTLAGWRVESISPTGMIEEVYCATVPESGAFALDTGGVPLLTGNSNPMGPKLITDMPSWMPEMWEACGFRWGGRWKKRPDCFTGDTMIVTVDGPRAIRDLAGREHVLLSTTEDPRSGVIESEWVKAPVRSFGWAETFEVTLSRQDRGHGRIVLRTTGSHRWPVRNCYSKLVRFVETRNLDRIDKAANKIPALEYPEMEAMVLDPDAIAQGIVWGDGSVYNRHGQRNPQAQVQLYGSKKTLRLFLEPYARYWKPTGTCDGLAACGLPASFKELVHPDSDLSVLAGFFAGWFACDGCIVGYANPSLSTSSPEALSWLHIVAPRLGLTITTVNAQPAGASGFNSTKDNHQVVFSGPVDERLLIRDDQRALNGTRRRKWAGWKIESVRATGISEEVFCPTVEGRNVVALATPTVPLLSGQSMHYSYTGNPGDIAHHLAAAKGFLAAAGAPPVPPPPVHVVPPMYSPPLVMRPIVAEYAPTAGGVRLVGDNGDTYNFFGAPYEGPEPGRRDHDPVNYEPVVAELKNARGPGGWLLATSWAVYSLGGAPYPNAMNQPDQAQHVVGRKPALMEDDGVNCLYVAETGERYNPG